MSLRSSSTKCVQTLSDQLYNNLYPPTPKAPTASEKLTQADTAFKKGDFATAGADYQQVLSILSRKTKSTYVQPCKQIQIVHCYSQLGKCYMEKSTPETALECFETALRLQIQHLGRNHIHSSHTMVDVGICLVHLSRYSEAILMLRNAYDIMSEKLGEDSLEAAKCCIGLANAYEESGEMVEAMTMYAKAMKIRESKLGCDHELTVETYHHVGRTYLTKGDSFAAVEFLERAAKFRLDMKLYEAAADSLFTLGVARRELRQYDHAYTCLNRAHYAYTKTLGEHHSKTMACKEQLDIVTCRRREVEKPAVSYLNLQ